MVVQYTVCDIDLNYACLFPFIGFVQGFLQDLILGIPHLGSFPHSVMFSYTVKASI